MSSNKPDPHLDIPTLTTSHASDDDLPEALQLVADSVAQQRQLAARCILLHPLSLSLYALAMAILAKLCPSLPTLATTASGVTMAVLVAVRWACNGYIEEAEGIGKRWLISGRGGGEEGEGEEAGPRRQEGRAMEDVVLVTRWGGEIIGVVIVRLIPDGKTSKSSRQDSKSRALFRAWTVKLRYRYKDVGRGLLEEAVRITRETLGEKITMEWDAQHANSRQNLPNLFNRPFQSRERLAKKMLQDVVSEQSSEFSSR
ncbi:MAG: hypothetical protein M1837_007047 [Sclerophora amabilis]|nr:MAG: hypothetical protein M1837_007047 [Sclerophora amabilis]